MGRSRAIPPRSTTTQEHNHPGATTVCQYHPGAIPPRGNANLASPCTALPLPHP